MCRTDAKVQNASHILKFIGFLQPHLQPQAILSISEIMVSYLPLSYIQLGCQLKSDNDCAVMPVQSHSRVFLAVLTESRGHCTLSPDVSPGEAAAPVFSGSCHAPSHQKLAVCVGSDRMTALRGRTVELCGPLARLAN